MGKLILSLLSGAWGYVAAAGLAASLAVGATYYVVHNANAAEISSLKLQYSQLQLQQSQTQTKSVTASLDQLQGFIANMHTAASNYQATLLSIDLQFAAIKKGITDAAKTPLPPDCRPTVDRLRALTAAFAAANKAASTGPRASSPMP